MRTRLAIAAVLVTGLLAGCGDSLDSGMPGSGPGAGKADGLDEASATLRFNADYTITQTGELRAGTKVRIQYDLERLPDCRGASGGYPQWNVTGWMSVDGAEPTTFEVSEVAGDDRVAKDAVLEVPAGGDLALWFSVHNRWGCNAYDSDFGNNYHFPIVAAPGGARLTFSADGQVVKTGALLAGSKLVVSYDLDRLPDCRGSSAGHPQWNIVGYYSVDGSPERTFEVSQVSGSDRVPVDASIDVPAGRELQMWFSVTNRWGCHAYDSNYGNNYRFAIE